MASVNFVCVRGRGACSAAMLWCGWYVRQSSGLLQLNSRLSSSCTCISRRGRGNERYVGLGGEDARKSVM
eukprot:283483-Rhodomonas_salina.2